MPILQSASPVSSDEGGCSYAEQTDCRSGAESGDVVGNG